MSMQTSLDADSLIVRELAIPSLAKNHVYRTWLKTLIFYA
jgi:hypothetical protein